MDGFIDIFTELVRQAGIPVNCIFRKKSVELPGFLAISETLKSRNSTESGEYGV
jgi:hypothetical protein